MIQPFRHYGIGSRIRICICISTCTWNVHLVYITNIHQSETCSDMKRRIANVRMNSDYINAFKDHDLACQIQGRTQTSAPFHYVRSRL